MNIQTDINYVARLLNLIIKINNGAIRIPTSHLMSEDIGSGFNVYWDESTKELVLESVAKGAKFYPVQGGLTWLNQPIPLPLPPQPRPLTSEELLGRAWTEAAATPTVEETRAKGKPRVLHMTDTSMAEAEERRSKEEIMREILNYRTPQPPAREERERVTFDQQTQTTPSSIPRTSFRT